MKFHRAPIPSIPFALARPSNPLTRHRDTTKISQLVDEVEVTRFPGRNPRIGERVDFRAGHEGVRVEGVPRPTICPWFTRRGEHEAVVGNLHLREEPVTSRLARVEISSALRPRLRRSRTPPWIPDASLNKLTLTRGAAETSSSKRVLALRASIVCIFFSARFLSPPIERYWQNCDLHNIINTREINY